MGMREKSKFVLSETFNNKDGKTSGSGFIGVILGLIAAVSIIALMFGYFFQIPDTLEMAEIILRDVLPGDEFGVPGDVFRDILKKIGTVWDNLFDSFKIEE